MSTGAKPDRGRTFRRLVAYVSQQRGRLIVSIFFLVLGTVVMAFQPLLFGRAVNEFAEGDSDNALRYGLAIVAVAIVGGLLIYQANKQLARLAQRGMELLRRDLFMSMQTLSLSFYDGEAPGDLNARVTSDIEAVNQFFTAAVPRIISSGMTVLTMLVIMFSLDFTMSVVVLLIVPMAFGVLIILGRRVQADAKAYQQLIGEVNGYAEEVVQGQRTVRAYGTESQTLERLTALSDEAREADKSAQFRSYIMQPASRLVNNLDVALVALIGGARAVSGVISLGDVVSFVGYSQQFGGQAMQLSQVVTQTLTAMAGADRVFRIIDTEPEIKQADVPIPMPSAEGKVDFDHVDFRYDETRQILFDNDFHVEPGQFIGLVGPTGAGKSTIINLLTRFYDIESGTISLDETDITQLDVNDLRRRCGVVLQVPYLFSETIMYNLRYGREGATDEECIEAAKSANAHRFIERLPEGYNTVLGEGAASLSQGQRQLLTIARAIVSQPDVLVLDEATSSVDTRTERRIQVAIDRLMADRTSFVIAHRLATVRHADAIIALDGGRIMEMGPHEELMGNRGFYHNLYMEQFAGQEVTVS